MCRKWHPAGPIGLLYGNVLLPGQRDDLLDRSFPLSLATKSLFMLVPILKLPDRVSAFQPVQVFPFRWFRSACGMAASNSIAVMQGRFSRVAFSLAWLFFIVWLFSLYGCFSLYGFFP